VTVIDTCIPCLGRWRCAIVVVCLPALVALLGCGGPPSGTVKGRVTFKGEPVVLGTIAFHGADGRVASGSISGGAYRVEKVPVGPATLTVQAHPPAAPLVPPPGESGPSESATQFAAAVARRTFVALPARFADKNTSGLTYAVQNGGQTYDVTLIP
jgi:hypothetical protein